MEQLRRGTEQKAVCYGLCVPSYLQCKIEQGAVHPNPDLLSALFRRLGWITPGRGSAAPLEEAIRTILPRLEYGLEVQEVYQTLEAQTGVLSLALWP